MEIKFVELFIEFPFCSFRSDWYQFLGSSAFLAAVNNKHNYLAREDLNYAF